MIFDTNVLIYLSKYILQPDRVFSKTEKNSISVITKIESLGYNFKNIEEYNLLHDLCSELNVISLSDQISEATIKIRRNNRIKLPDAIIYAKALIEKEPLITNNITDFKQLGNQVELVNPFTL